ncbi:LysR family transcriptional regulator [Dyella nitratireducens]|uniref:LysR family transcriptional regulator n=1 Tax=Dyella nitratireducens TaxID=1849580 RepID=A0ABQ1GKV1_9GAMM|nr:LysR family transcriptional regulator [Dyella nitratireducens]GGA45914.1 LysR family transcriptional regulator [Dyella nitratireducens]GLQ41381.1 LysR family transcriptional regulator [Dyella nitratireducens]
MNVEMRYLHTFRAVCEAGSVRAAAGVLHRTEQALSYQLRKLEEALGMPVFQRGSGRLIPNAAGERLLAFCREMGRDWEKLHQDIHAASPIVPLRISAVSGFGRYQLLPLFRDGPLADVPIRMRYPTAEDIIRQVESGVCDLGFVHRMDTHDRLSHTPVGVEEIVLIASAHLVQPLALDAQSLRDARYVTYDESDYVFATWFTQVLGMNMTRLNTVTHFEELEEVLDWVAAGRGISIVPTACIAEHEARGEVVALRKPETRCRNTIYAVLDPARHHAAIERVLEAVRTRAMF